MISLFFAYLSHLQFPDYLTILDKDSIYKMVFFIMISFIKENNIQTYLPLV